MIYHKIVSDFGNYFTYNWLRHFFMQIIYGINRNIIYSRQNNGLLFHWKCRDTAHHRLPIPWCFFRNKEKFVRFVLMFLLLFLFFNRAKCFDIASWSMKSLWAFFNGVGITTLHHEYRSGCHFFLSFWRLTKETGCKVHSLEFLYLDYNQPRPSTTLVLDFTHFVKFAKFPEIKRHDF